MKILWNSSKKRTPVYVLGAILLSVLILPVFFLFKTGAVKNRDHDFLLNPMIKYHKFKLLRPFRPELQNLVERLKTEEGVDEIAVYFRSLNDGVWIGVNEKTLFAPASLMKVPLLMVFLKKAEQEPDVLKKKLVAGPKGRFNQFIPSKIQIEQGKLYSVDQLLKVMIVDSNNDAMKTLAQYADPLVGMKMYRQLGYTSTFTDQGDFLSLKTYAGTFRVLYNGTYLNEAMSAKALRLLSQTDFKKGIVAGVPQEVTVANKFGEYTDTAQKIKQLHDVGIIYYPENPYILGVMTRGTDYECLERVIQEISFFIYHEVDSQYRAQSGPDFAMNFNDED